jgi:hypothetical protein
MKTIKKLLLLIILVTGLFSTAQVTTHYGRVKATVVNELTPVSLTTKVLVWDGEEFKYVNASDLLALSGGGSGDNLGDHIATQDLTIDGFNLNMVGSEIRFGTGSVYPRIFNTGSQLYLQGPIAANSTVRLQALSAGNAYSLVEVSPTNFRINTQDGDGNRSVYLNVDLLSSTRNQQFPDFDGVYALEADSSIFDGNLSTTDNTLQEIAQKFDDYIGTSIIEPNNQIVIGTGTGVTSHDTFKRFFNGWYTVGVDDTTAGFISLYGDASNGINSGVRYYNNVPNSSSVNYWTLGNRSIGGDLGDFALTADGNLGSIIFKADDATKGVSVPETDLADYAILGNKAVVTQEKLIDYVGNVGSTGNINDVLTNGNTTNLDIISTGNLTINEINGLRFKTGSGAESLSIANGAPMVNNLIHTIAVGGSAMTTATGDYSTAIGAFSAEDNSGRDVSAVGKSSARNNTGDYSIFLGNYSGRDNIEDDVVGIGTSTLSNNEGRYSIAIGRNAGEFNKGEGAVGIGNTSLQHNTGINNTAIGHNAGAIPDLDTVNAKIIIDPINLIDGSDNITITAHNFGANGTTVGLLYTHDGVAINPLVSGRVYNFVIVDLNTLNPTNNIGASGTGNHTFTPFFQYTNYSLLGSNTKATKNNQIVLGDSNIEEIFSNGVFKSESNISEIGSNQKHLTTVEWVEDLNLQNQDSYGGMGFEGNVTETTITNTNTYEKVLGTTTSTNLTSDITHTSGRLTYTGTETKHFTATANFSTSVAANNQFVDFKIAVNGVPLGFASRRKIDSLLDIEAQGVSFDFNLSTNDFVELYGENETSTTNLLIGELYLFLTTNQ